MLSQKKFQAALFTAIAAGLARLGWNVDLETIAVIMSPIVAYIVSQGIADHGKGAKVVEVAGAKAGVSTASVEVSASGPAQPPQA